MISTDNVIPFGARRGMWLDQVFRDSEMKGEFFRVMYAITVRLNTKTFTASTSDPDLAALAQVDTKTAQRARECAVKRGHISQVFHGCKGTVITPLLASKPGQIVQVQDDEGGLKLGLKPGLAVRVTHGKTRGNDSLLSDSQDSHKYKKEEGYKNGNPRGPTAPEKESTSTDSSKPSSPLPCGVPPRPIAGWRDRLDEPPLLTGEEQAALGRLAALSKANGGGVLTGMSSCRGGGPSGSQNDNPIPKTGQKPL
jgi:hypothetical protein